MIEVNRCEDGFIEFIEDGNEIYDLLVTNSQPFHFWMEHLSDKNWFTEEVAIKFIAADGSKLIGN
jgi:hypothetical protein